MLRKGLKTQRSMSHKRPDAAQLTDGSFEIMMIRSRQEVHSVVCFHKDDRIPHRWEVGTPFF